MLSSCGVSISLRAWKHLSRSLLLGDLPSPTPLRLACRLQSGGGLAQRACVWPHGSMSAGRPQKGRVHTGHPAGPAPRCACTHALTHARPTAGRLGQPIKGEPSPCCISTWPGLPGSWALGSDVLSQRDGQKQITILPKPPWSSGHFGHFPIRVGGGGGSVTKPSVPSQVQGQETKLKVPE